MTVTEAQKLLKEWKQDFHNGITKYCSGYPAVRDTLFKIVPDIDALLNASAIVAAQEQKEKDVTKIVEWRDLDWVKGEIDKIELCMWAYLDGLREKILKENSPSTPTAGDGG